ncbi:MAG: hypothetical protein IJO24_01640 [Clostridia bacterium]|nr:hypothetical protein [Clostridia bacterium]
MKTKKTLAILLAVMMILSSVPMFASAAPIALSASHVTEWPKAVVNTESGVLSYGMTVGEYVTLVGGKVSYNGTEVPGKFIHRSDTATASVGDESKLNITFVPDDETAYKRFNKLRSPDVTVKVVKTVPALEDPTNPPAAVAAYGATLADTEITGSKLINPYNSSTTVMANSLEWLWVNPDTVMTESGYHQIIVGSSTSTTIGNYYDLEPTIREIYVPVSEDYRASVLEELPQAVNAVGGKTFGDLAFEGGRVISYGTDTVVEGTWSITQYMLESGSIFAPNLSTKLYNDTVYKFDLLFTPDDLTKHTTIETTVTVVIGAAETKITVNPSAKEIQYTDGLTAGDLTLSGGQANLSGTFNVTDPAQPLRVGLNTVNVTFTPNDSQFESKSVDINVIVKGGDITATVDPDYVCTFEYGTKSLRGAISGDASTYGITTNVDADVTKAKASVASVFDANGNEVDETDRYLAPGNYTAKIYVTAETVHITGVGLVQLYNATYVEFPVVITKKASTEPFGSLNITGTTEEEGKATAGIYYKYDGTEGVNGYCVLKINGETVVDNIAPAAMVYDFSTKTSGKFTATLEYVPAETDYIEFETNVLTVEFELEVLEPEDPVIPGIGGDDDNTGDSDITLPDLDLDTDGSHKFGFVNIIKNLVEALKAFIQQIGDFFSNMSLEGLGNIMG